MIDNRWGVVVEDYDSAKAYINRGRKKSHRTLYHKNLYASYRNDGKSIGIHFKNWGTDLVRYVPNGLAIICLHPTYNYQSTRDVINRYANLEGLYQRNNKLYILQDTDTYTDSRQVRCPKCAGRGVHWYQCNGLKPSGRQKEEKRRFWNGREITTFTGQKVYVYNCTCLQTNPQLNPDNHRAKITCSFCNGLGHRELGNKRKAFQWDGDPLTIDLSTGRILQVHKPQLLVNVIKQKEGEPSDREHDPVTS